MTSILLNMLFGFILSTRSDQSQNAYKDENPLRVFRSGLNSHEKG